MADLVAGHGMSQRLLYGENAIAALPSDVVDVSSIRDIPDNQEVFTHPISDQSIIFDILEYVNEPDEEALKTHFHELAKSNEAEENENCQILGTDKVEEYQISLKQCHAAYILSGQQMISKFNESSKNVVNIYMALFRLPEHETDIIVTMNDPVSVSPQSSSHNPGNDALGQKWTIEQFKALVSSVKLLNQDFLG